MLSGEDDKPGPLSYVALPKVKTWALNNSSYFQLLLEPILSNTVRPQMQMCLWLPLLKLLGVAKVAEERLQ